MSEYYDLFVAFDLKPDTPQSIIEALNYMLSDSDDLTTSIEDETIDEDWRGLLNADNSNMIYFPGIAISVLRNAYRYNLPNNQGGKPVYRNTFCYRNEILDDGLDTFMAFFDWIQPYVETQGLIGYIRPEDENNYWRLTAFDGKIDFTQHLTLSFKR
jgi:hypothetical protein